MGQALYKGNALDVILNSVYIRISLAPITFIYCKISSLCFLLYMIHDHLQWGLMCKIVCGVPATNIKGTKNLPERAR